MTLKWHSLGLHRKHNFLWARKYFAYIYRTSVVFKGTTVHILNVALLTKWLCIYEDMLPRTVFLVFRWKWSDSRPGRFFYVEHEFRHALNWNRCCSQVSKDEVANINMGIELQSSSACSGYGGFLWTRYVFNIRVAETAGNFLCYLNNCSLLKSELDGRVDGGWWMDRQAGRQAGRQIDR